MAVHGREVLQATQHCGFLLLACHPVLHVRQPGGRPVMARNRRREPAPNT
jgi:hypothetical protein